MTKMVNVKVNGRWDILLPQHRALRPEWTSEQGWERARLDDMFKYVKEFQEVTDRKPVAYYIGAEEGDMAALLHMWGAEVVLFEPNPLVWPNIKAIWDANKLSNPHHIFDGFASSETKQDVINSLGYMFGWPESAYGPMIADHGFKNLCEADGLIPQITIDHLAETLSDPNKNMIPDVISLDVEGAEWEVLRGAEQTLRKHHPRIYLSLHPEFLYEIYKEYANDLRHWLKQIGYKETLLDYQHEVHLMYERGDR